MHSAVRAERFIAKNRSERLRVSVSDLNGTPVLDIRVYSGETATRKGVCVRVETGRDLALAVAEVLGEAGYPLS